MANQSVNRYRPAYGTEPCKQCPFRRTAPPGWLGEMRPEAFIIEISMEHPLPCHSSINYRRPDWLERWNAQRIGKMCAGSLILAANIGKVPRDPAFPRLPANKELVFATHTEFIEYHKAAKTKSWEMGEV